MAPGASSKAPLSSRGLGSSAATSLARELAIKTPQQPKPQLPHLSHTPQMPQPQSSRTRKSRSHFGGSLRAASSLMYQSAPATTSDGSPGTSSGTASPGTGGSSPGMAASEFSQLLHNSARQTSESSRGVDGHHRGVRGYRSPEPSRAELGWQPSSSSTLSASAWQATDSGKDGVEGGKGAEGNGSPEACRSERSLQSTTGSATSTVPPEPPSASMASPPSSASALASAMAAAVKSAPFGSFRSESSQPVREFPQDVAREGPRKSAPAEPVKLRQIREIAEGVKIFDMYLWDEVLQEGGDGGKVVVCRPRRPRSNSQCSSRRTSSKVGFRCRSASKSSRTGSKTIVEAEFVMKIKSKQSLRKQGLEEQFRKAQEKVLNLAPHKGVIRMHEVLENEDFFYVVMEKATGGSFFDSLVNDYTDGVVPDADMKRLINEILEAVDHVHKQGLLHRDIKPDNLAMQVHLDPQSPDGKRAQKKVVLIDFDHADPDWSPRHPILQQEPETTFGTLRFNAPETFQGDFSQESDLYSVGVILYMLMAGKMPYDDAIFTDTEPSPRQGRRRRYSDWKDAIYQRMQEADIDWDCQPWPAQPVCKDFCQKLLAFSPPFRFANAEDAMAHPWFKVD